MNWGTGDLIGDGTVDINDLTIVLTNYNTSVNTSPSVSFSGAVPEPGSLLLVALATAGLLAFARRYEA